MCVCVCVCVYICLCVCVCVYIYIYIYIKQEYFSNQLYKRKKSYLPAYPAFFVHPSIFLDDVHLCLETSLRDVINGQRFSCYTHFP